VILHISINAIPDAAHTLPVTDLHISFVRQVSRSPFTGNSLTSTGLLGPSYRLVLASPIRLLVCAPRFVPRRSFVFFEPAPITRQFHISRINRTPYREYTHSQSTTLQRCAHILPWWHLGPRHSLTVQNLRSSPITIEPPLPFQLLPQTTSFDRKHKTFLKRWRSQALSLSRYILCGRRVGMGGFWTNPCAVCRDR
jgi:hypothetical protein